MNPSTNETQTSPSVLNAQRWNDIDQELENAACLLRLLSDQHTASMHYPAFEVIQTILEQVRSDLSELPKGLGIPAPIDRNSATKRYPLPESVSDLVENHIRDEAFELEAITKSIFAWAANQKVFSMEGGVLDLDVGDVVVLSDMAISKAQRIVSLANEFESKVTSVGVQA